MLSYAPVAFSLSYFYLISVLALGLVCAVFFSYAPDFDMQLPLVSHRGATRTLLAGAVASSVVAGLAISLAVSGSYPTDTHVVVVAGANRSRFAGLSEPPCRRRDHADGTPSTPTVVAEEIYTGSGLCENRVG